MATEAPVASTSTGKVVPQTVLYCAVCHFPPEYCEFQPKKAKCKAWLEENHPDLHAKYYSESASKIVVKRIERNKKKFVTTVNGLHHFGVDLKKAAKLLANKFGAGATVSKTPQGDEEILVQGDVSTEIEEMMLDKQDKKCVDVFGGKIEQNQISFVEVKLKKKVVAPPEVAPQGGPQ
ncbi:putative RNA binding protein Tma22 [Rhodotorula toruloides ATCC 204091]|uniref:Translation machinery-associated protein 22 n=1 Tax=Rhodotorula toruloides TaxID=5286 RepID=A0A0K3CHV2_RHOTO|nr:putative RNA binding protein Tma22 [Rhodotorula toruloides ATCC 204091]